MDRRTILKYGACTALAGGLSANRWARASGKSEKAAKHPNVVMIVIDTARADRFSCYGYTRPTTPYIDTLAATGVVYEKAYATTFWTLPTHASIFTGLYPSQAGATTATNHLPNSNVTIADVLQGNGYNTMGFSCNPWVCKERGFAKGFKEFVELWRSENLVERDGVTLKDEVVAAEKITAWLKSSDDKEPFFIFANLNQAHLPYQPPKPFLNRFLKHDYDIQDILCIGNVNAMWAHLVGMLKLSANDFEILSDLYDGTMALGDYCVEQIIEAVRRRGVLDDTLIVIMSDHGENLGDHGMIDHMLTMYDTTIRIPLIIRYPSRFPAGTRSNDLVSQVDIAPTILDVCKIQHQTEQPELDERSIVSPNWKKQNFIFAENERPRHGINIINKLSPGHDISGIDCPTRVIRTKHDKMIWTVDIKKELYNTNDDPEELINLASKDSDRCNELHTVLKLWGQQMIPADTPPSFDSQDQESLERLRALGYLE